MWGQSAPAKAPTAEQLRVALSSLLESGADWSRVEIYASCPSDTAYREVRVFGSGVGIWNRTTQFTLERRQVAAILGALQKGDFASFREIYGGSQEPEEQSAVTIICRVGLKIGKVAKFANQRRKGEQSKELRRLANEILDICDGPAQSGTTITTLTEGLRKLSEQRLASETLELMLHRKPVGAQSEADGFLMRVNGRSVTTQTYRTGQGYGHPVVLSLTDQEVSKLARQLSADEIGSLPVNLYAPYYTDLTVRVLGREKSLQARRFSGMTAATHGEKQVHFDNVYQLLHDLHSRVLKQGAPSE